MTFTHNVLIMYTIQHLYWNRCAYLYHEIWEHFQRFLQLSNTVQINQRSDEFSFISFVKDMKHIKRDRNQDKHFNLHRAWVISFEIMYLKTCKKHLFDDIGKPLQKSYMLAISSVIENRRHKGIRRILCGLPFPFRMRMSTSVLWNILLVIISVAYTIGSKGK